jgi:peroxiredoxin Q/BCP
MNRFERKNAVVLGCSPDPPETQARFKRKHKLNFGLLSDVEKKVANDYGVWRQKSFLGKKYMGIARTTFVIGPDGAIRKVFENVKPGGHADEVLAAISS